MPSDDFCFHCRVEIKSSHLLRVKVIFFFFLGNRGERELQRGQQKFEVTRNVCCREWRASKLKK